MGQFARMKVAAVVIFTKVHKIKSVDKGKRYKRRKSSKEFACLDVIYLACDPVTTDKHKSHSIPFPEKGRREGKAPMTKEGLKDSRTKQRTNFSEKAQRDVAEAIRMAEEEELTEEQKKRRAQFSLKLTHLLMKIWVTIREKLEGKQMQN
ncbi:hypothetical protein Tco_0747944 [Tanacetum coccineum]|uniref:Uncharacterized protein n=1 Tax=Tanacetum coccineum TaxID=301880 RepID=A0ABQ4YUA0_9ASTR